MAKKTGKSPRGKPNDIDLDLQAAEALANATMPIEPQQPPAPIADTTDSEPNRPAVRELLQEAILNQPSPILMEPSVTVIEEEHVVEITQEEEQIILDYRQRQRERESVIMNVDLYDDLEPIAGSVHTEPLPIELPAYQPVTEDTSPFLKEWLGIGRGMLELADELRKASGS
jgi:hypothetical protein